MSGKMAKGRNDDCISCGAAITWLKTPAGKYVPYNTETLSNDREPGDRAGKYPDESCHFDTCPQRYERQRDREAELQSIAKYRESRGYL